MENSETNFVRIIKEICRENQITVRSFGGDWGFLLEKDGRRGFIIGYQFGLNAAVSKDICTDKSIASEIMEQDGVPCVKHICFMAPHMFQYVGGNGNWQELTKLLNQYGVIVCKDNAGTGGNQVYLVRNQKELEQAADAVFQRADAMAVSPYYPIHDEYRVILLDGEVQIVFQKIRRHLTGNGTSTVRKLYAEYLLEGGRSHANLPAADLDRVLREGEEYFLNWKHNLGQGADARVMEENEADAICALARRAAACLNIRFSSVDVVMTEEGLKVMEVNAGVMMENLAGMSREYYEKAKSIYERAIFKML
ncbi:MAG TPA: hypothetical protein IAB48_11435 [Candidatus Fimimorpha excrementavium]|nr:hypothetical protein [Candidatus Fimimorpha excrementavium]